MADIFVSYTSSDRRWAFWIGQELEALGHTPHLHDWEIPGGGDIMAWMEARHEQADRVLCIVSRAYLAKPYSSLERRAAQWAAVADRPNFVLPVFVEACKAPTLFATTKRCDLYGVSEEDARTRLKTFLEPGRPSERTAFPGNTQRSGDTQASRQTARNAQAPFPGKTALSNIPIGVPRCFMGRDEALVEIATALSSDAGRVAITTLHGLRGVGKTTLAAVYAEHHRGDYRVTWWIRAQQPSSITADLVALGTRLGWVNPNDKERDGLATVIERLRYEGRRILLIFDNAPDPEAIERFLPRGGRCHILITSNSAAWRKLADTVEIGVWPAQTGADYLLARTGYQDTASAKALSELLGGLPLAHEQAAAYCERLAISFDGYRDRFEAAPSQLLDESAPAEYNDGMTVVKTFALAIEEARRIDPAAKALIVNAALLPPEPVPLFLFTEAKDNFEEPLALAAETGRLDEAVAALCSFALVDRETIVDEIDPTVTTEVIRLHRLVRHVAAEHAGDTIELKKLFLLHALSQVYPSDVSSATNWPRARRLDGLALGLFETVVLPDVPNSFRARLRDFSRVFKLVNAIAKMVGNESRITKHRQSKVRYWLASHVPTPRLIRQGVKLLAAFAHAEDWGAHLLHRLGLYRSHVVEDYAQAQALHARALALREKRLGPEARATAVSLYSLGLALSGLGNYAQAKHNFERAITIFDKVLGPDSTESATNLDALATVLQREGDPAGALAMSERALRIRERVYGPDHHVTATSLHNLAVLLSEQGNDSRAQSLYERALTTTEKAFGVSHFKTASMLKSLAMLLLKQGELDRAQKLAQQALSIYEKEFGPADFRTADCLLLTAHILQSRGQGAKARSLRARAQSILAKTSGSSAGGAASS